MEYRLNKYISGSGFCSRREADRLIEEGHVTLDGKRATIGMRVLPGQTVRVHGEIIKNEIEPVYIIFNKPVGVVSTTDPQEKDNIIDYISHEQRIFPIGRLDKDSQGLIILTNDGDIVNKILRAGNNHKKEYLVKVNRPITKDFLNRMSKGVPILDRVTRRCEIEEINQYTFRISLVQGLNRQIRRMCAYFNYEVLKLERIQIMNIQLGNLGQGNWRNLTLTELEGLFDLLEKSQSDPQTKRAVSSDKAMNKALREHDIKTDYRKANSVAQLPKKTSTNHTKRAFTERTETDKTPSLAKKKKESTGPRIGKSKVSKVKASAKQRPPERKKGKTSR
ncbi:23S rRNA pseudouridine(2604) synthase RluF [Parabacteroides sp. 52]|uniref:23S rRNA pseudouridine(2604) synthase RluF n=1 Tax=unclassified Parabacteroides TaxID=2649774 RepID=UPI0013D1F5CB|nr:MULTISPECIES: 23S rRNA pseudouridine(2604) synthase RluF [unclassified Parabacteroides]MDH6534007.1 23S rRNA pseudouridine2604 synthase [Parabacteroides sp. PM5-20]NDV54748.1 23S rRNA pseudouridine(2604) synthase RluF [Parabacteroides sp. 52]